MIREPRGPRKDRRDLLRLGQSVTAALPSPVVRNQPPGAKRVKKMNVSTYLRSIHSGHAVCDLKTPMSDHASILVVDDEPHVSDMLQEFFLDLGYAVDVATTGDEAVRRASSKRPDAVILDMRLPDTTGDQLLTRLRTLDGSVPIVTAQHDDRN